MALEDVKERLKEQALATLQRVRESSAWIQFMEKYQDLGPGAQKAVLAGGSFVLALILFLLPWTFFSSSQNTMGDFEAKKQLMRELFHVSRAASALPMTPQAMTPGDLRSAVQNVLSTERPLLLPEQTLSVTDFDNVTAGSSALPKGLTQKGVIVNLSRLNLDQVVKIGTRLQALRSTAKMVATKIQSTAADPHYFDATFKIVAFNLPAEPAPKTAPGKAGAKPTAKPTAAAGKDEE